MRQYTAPTTIKLVHIILGY